MFCIYRVGHFKNFSAFKDHFNKRAKEHGFDGIHFVQLLNHFDDTPGIYDQHVDAYAEYHPMYINRFTKSDIEKTDKFVKQDVQTKWNDIVNLEPNKKAIRGKQYYRGIHVGWDSSPRGKNRFWSVDVNSTPESFAKFVKLQAKRVLEDTFNKEKFMFVFAWNEWGEGAVLEPDNLFGNQYLKFFNEAIKNI
jgi:hypothetical protein